METNHLSANSIGDEKFNEGASSMKSKSSESNIPRIQIYDETGRSVEVSQGSSITVQNESWKTQKNRSSVCTIGKDLASNSSFTVGDENLKASESMLSLSSISTTAICGSSSSDIPSSEEEPFGDLENASGKRGADKIDSTQSNNQLDQQYEETDNAGVTLGSRSKVHNESMKVQEDSSICTIGKDSESDISLRVDNENLKTSEFMLSFNSTAATCGSSSSDIASSEEEPFGDLENVSPKRGTDIDSTQSNNQFGQQHEETDNTGGTLRSRSKVYNESMKVQEGSSICTMGKDSESDISLRVNNENLKTSESMLSFISTAATWGSSSPDVTSSEEEPLGDLQDNSEKRETQHVSNIKNPILELSPKAANEISNNPSAYCGTNLGDESQTDFEFTSAKESLLSEDSSLFKSQDINNSLDEDTLQSLPKERLSKHIKAEEFPLKMSLSSTLDCFSNMEDPSSNNNPITVPPLVGMVSSLNTRRVETLEISDCGTTLDVVDCNGTREVYWKKEDKSVRRKGVPTLSEVASGFLAPSIHGSSIKIEPSFLQAPKSLQQTSTEGDWVLYENSGRSADENFSVQKPCVEELISSWKEIADADVNRGLEIESLVEEVHHFFENNHMDAHVNTSSEESKHQITSKDFSDEFPRRHGLLSHEKLIKECLNNLERNNSPNLKTQLELKEMCKMLMKFSIPEEAFIEFVGRKILVMSGRECDVESFSEISNQEIQDYFNDLRFSITEDFDFFVMVKLYKKLMYEGASFASILDESKEHSAAEEGCPSKSEVDVLQKDESKTDTGCPSKSGCDMLQHDKSATDASGPSSSNGDMLQRDKSATDTGCPSSSKGDVFPKEESATESPKTHLRESEETLNVVLMPDSNVLDSSVSAENELCCEKISLSGSEMTEELQASDDLGSNVSAEDSDYTINRTGDNSEE